MQEMEMSQPASNNKNMMMIGGLLALVAVIGVGVVLARGKNATTDTMQKVGVTPAVSAQPVASAPVMDETESTSASPAAIMEAEGEVRTITIEAGSFYYKPAAITMKKGETIKIVMTSKDMMHDFNIDALNVKIPITKSGETNTVEFTADEVGTFEYYCSVGQHKANGQVGTLVVTE